MARRIMELVRYVREKVRQIYGLMLEAREKGAEVVVVHLKFVDDEERWFSNIGFVKKDITDDECLYMSEVFGEWFNECRNNEADPVRENTARDLQPIANKIFRILEELHDNDITIDIINFSNIARAAGLKPVYS